MDWSFGRKFFVTGATVALVALVALIGSSTKSPDITYAYYPAGSKTTVTVTQTVDCTSDGSKVVVLNTPAVSTVYFADYSTGPYSVRIKSLDGATVDTDFTFSFFDDGRLKGVNASSTGQGEAVVKSALSVAGILPSLALPRVPVKAAPRLPGQPGTPVRPKPPECNFVENWAGGEPLTLTYVKEIDLANASSARIPLDPTPDSAVPFNELKGELPRLEIQVEKPSSIASARYNGDTETLAARVTLRQTAACHVKVFAKDVSIFDGYVVVPLSSTYTLPIPKASRFGKQSFALALSEAGAVTSLQYGRSAGAAGALNSIAAVGTAAAPPSAATQAASVKAQADLIAQQQRLTRCQARPDKCT